MGAVTGTVADHLKWTEKVLQLKKKKSDVVLGKIQIGIG